MNKKIIIYQVFTRLFGNRNTTRKEWGNISENGCGKMNDFSEEVLASIHNMGISHIWYTGLIRHASQTDYTAYGILKSHQGVVKGIAGSPYAISDYYDIDPDLSVDVEYRMKEFEQLVKRTHQAKLKLVMDFVPNHVARQYHSISKPQGTHDLGEDDDVTMGFSPQNNFYYCPGVSLQPQFDTHSHGGDVYDETPAKATGNDRFDNRPEINDWYETVKLNYGVDYCGGRITHFEPIPDTWNKMYDILCFWASKGVDAFRCDMAEMVPVEFWHWVTSRLKAHYPSIIFIGEVYTPSHYREYISYGGFDYLYDKVGMYDTLRAVTCGMSPASNITGTWQSVDDIHDHMLFFLENHDEQRIASDFFAGDGRKAIPAFVVTSLLRNNPLMLYAGQEFGERGMDKEGFSGFDGRTTIFDYWNVDTISRWFDNHLMPSEKSLWTIYHRILHIASTEKAVIDGNFFDLMYVNPMCWCFNPDKQYAFIRKYGKEVLLVVVNFDGLDVHVQVNVPQHAFEFLGISQKQYSCIDLLTGERQKIQLSYDCAVAIDIPSYGAKVLKFKIGDGNKL